MFLLLWFIVTVIVGTGSAWHLRDGPSAKADVYPDTLSKVDKCDKYVDDLISEMKTKRGHLLDPLRPEDKEISVGFFGKATLADNTISGLSSLYRSDHCKIYMDGNDHVVSVPLRATNIGLETTVVIEHALFPDGRRQIRGGIRSADLVLTMDVDRDIGMPMMKDVHVTDTGDVFFQTEPTSVMDKVFNWVVEALGVFWKGTVKELLENHLRNQLEYMINEESPLVF